MSTMKAGLLLIALTLAGCTAASGPMYNAYTVALPNGEHVYRVTCYGMLEGPGACRKQAESICKEQPVMLLEAQSGLYATFGGKPDDRSILFRCGAPTATTAPDLSAPLPMPPAVTVLDADANFDTDSADLKPSARARLDRLIEESSGATIHTVTVSGYTDSVGSDDYNVGLSERRARAVDTYLQSHGLKADRFVNRGYGKADPVDSNDTLAGRAHNRRVEVRLDMDRK
ncbi:OmpA family protein [Burkholderia seminalis]|uniref:OmpA family protein n=1 Tax=Burkholderia seminalis TaxID=488731 RepID=UPI0014540FAE|nr:OmpA family protein [Burkholderia seminalis]MCA8435473.1 OmpA family protein [Burkholderia seminalis]VWC41787.1 flagellar motor protein MotB [Burkholderia seminalis]